MQLRQNIQSLHRWLGLAMAAQLIVWMASGVVMSQLPIEHVRGETAAAYSAPAELKVQNYFPPAGVLAEVDGPREATLKFWLGREVYVVAGAGGKVMFDADTGEKLSPLSEADARRAALADFTGDGKIKATVFFDVSPREAGARKNLWRVDFDDRDETRLYVDSGTGEIAARRNRVWRFYDFFWMLHIMDYDERENFNNPLVRIFSITGLAFAITGLALVIVRLRSGRYADDFKRAAAKREGAKSTAAD